MSLLETAEENKPDSYGSLKVVIGGRAKFSR